MKINELPNQIALSIIFQSSQRLDKSVLLFGLWQSKLNNYSHEI